MNNQDGEEKKQSKLVYNFIYFGLLFLGLASIHVYSVLLAAHFSEGSPALFIFHAIAQAGIEAGILAYIAAFLQNRGWGLAQKIFISFTVLVCITHIIDFHLVRLMDISIWYALDFVLDESWRNFLELLIASTVPFTKILLGIVLLAVILIVAFFLFRRSQMHIQKANYSYSRPLSTRTRKGLFLTIFLLFGMWEYTAVRDLDVREYERMAKALPMKRLLFSPSSIKAQIPFQLKAPLQEDEFRDALASNSMEMKKRPNVYLFIAETLREEFLTEETAPHLYNFKQKNISIPQTRSSSNATQVSWFSLFFSQSPLHFGEIKRAEWTSGSPLVQAFKQAGYKIHLYSGSRLSYYEMNRMLFGSNYRLTDDYYVNLPSRDQPAWQCDRAAVAKLCDDIRFLREEEGHLFITFIESTHFDYSWPAEQFAEFAPFCETINFSMAACLQENIALIQNRYRNAIHYIDGLIGGVFSALEDTDRMKDAVIVVTADHGEEFFEEGNLFHASGLSQEQIRVPLYCRFGQTNPSLQVRAEMASHVDVLPTLLHYLYGEEKLQPVFQGESLFRESRWPFIVSGRYNGCRSPHEFLVQNSEGHVLHARFDNPSQPARSRSIQVLGCKNHEGQSIQFTSSFIEEKFAPAFTALMVPSQ